MIDLPSGDGECGAILPRGFGDAGGVPPMDRGALHGGHDSRRRSAEHQRSGGVGVRSNQVRTVRLKPGSTSPPLSTSPSPRTRTAVGLVWT